MRRTAIVGTVILCLLALFAGRQDLSAQTTDVPLIRLRSVTFDPQAGAPTFAASAQTHARSGQHDLFLIQFEGPVQEAWKLAVQEAGVRLYGYIPDYAFIARLGEASPQQIEQLAFVRWVGPYQPAYKLDTALAQTTSAASNMSITVDLQMLPDSDLDAIAAQITSWNGRVIAQTSSQIAAYMRVDLAADRIGDAAALDGVIWIAPYIPPQLLNNTAGGTIMQANAVRIALDLYGRGQTVAVADSGLDTGALSTLHPDVRGRVRTTYCLGRPKPCDWSDRDGHGTHVVGSVLGNGTASGSNPATHAYLSTQAGVAPEAELVMQSISDANGNLSGLPMDTGDLLRQAYRDGARIHNNSWGGATSCSDPPYCTKKQYGEYTLDSYQVDLAAWQHKDLLVLFAAGNAGVDKNKDGVIDLDAIFHPGTAKNVLTVGATESTRAEVTTTWREGWPGSFEAAPIANDKVADNANGMAAFSSRGPTDDGRIKPDLVAPGTYIVSTRSRQSGAGVGWGAHSQMYVYNGGTSMSTPLVAGAAALTREWLMRMRAVANPSAALIKALLLNGTADISPGQYGTTKPEIPAARPNNVAGWGRVDLQRTLDPTSPRNIWFNDDTSGVATGETTRYEISIGEPQGQMMSTQAVAAPTQQLPAQPAGASTPVEIAGDSIAATQTLQNGGFERGIWEPWQPAGNPQLSTTIVHTGGYSVKMGGSHNTVQQITQAITIPSNAKTVSFDFWYRIATEESRIDADRACYGLWATNGSGYAVRCFDIATLGNRGWAQEVYTLRSDEVSTVRGQTVFVGLVFVSNDTLLSTMWADDIAVRVDTTGASQPASGGSLRVMLVWTDYPALPNASKALVNDLDLEIIGPDGTRYRGNQGAYPSGHRCLRANGADTCNNVEGLALAQARPGTYTVIVRGANVPQAGRQPFAIAVTGDDARIVYQHTLYIPVATR